MHNHRRYAKIVVNSPLNYPLDYLIPDSIVASRLKPGIRVRIPFRNSHCIGILLSISNKSSVKETKLKSIIEIIDEQPLLSDDILQLCQWASHYYHHPIGDVMLGTLPTLLAKGEQPSSSTTITWQITPCGKGIDYNQLKNAKKQMALLELLQSNTALPQQQLLAQGFTSTQLNALANKGYIEKIIRDKEVLSSHLSNDHKLTLNAEQYQVTCTVLKALDHFNCFLLEGVTGSGKTEVYLQIIEQVIESQRQAMVLIPEIGLTPQTVARFQRRFNVCVAVLHSGLSDRERLDNWLLASTGKAKIIIGTRSAIFLPLKNPGIIIIDEEHDASFKQQDGFRYSARDIAVYRAKKYNIPIVLGSATPSFESIHNAWSKRYHHLKLTGRAGLAKMPQYRLIDMRNQKLSHGLSTKLVAAINQHLEKNSQVLLFLNRRGYAPSLLCHQCGWAASCKRCDAHLTLHSTPAHLHCHHCDAAHPVLKICPGCQGNQLFPLGMGTERLEQSLQQIFPNTKITRIDKDTTRRKNALETVFNQIHQGESQILVGTQMLAKGHHFPNVTLVGVINADSGLFSPDFRAKERLAQLITQVSGRAGRGDKAGEVIIQTYNPDNHFFHLLIQEGYAAIAKYELSERQQANLPPFAKIALLRAESTDKNNCYAFLQTIVEKTKSQQHSISILGPVSAIMEKRAGRYRALLLFQSKERHALHAFLDTLTELLSAQSKTKNIRFALDVDPSDLF